MKELLKCIKHRKLKNQSISCFKSFYVSIEREQLCVAYERMKEIIEGYGNHSRIIYATRHKLKSSCFSSDFPMLNSCKL